MFRRIITFFSIYRSLLQDKRTPARTKILPWAALLYLIVPLDIIPDVLPLLGQLDDIGIIILFVWIAMNAVPSFLYKEYAQPARRDVIDVTPKD